MVGVFDILTVSNDENGIESHGYMGTLVAFTEADFDSGCESHG